MPAYYQTVLLLWNDMSMRNCELTLLQTHPLKVLLTVRVAIRLSSGEMSLYTMTLFNEFYQLLFYIFFV